MRGIYHADWHEIYAGSLAESVAAHGVEVSMFVRDAASEFRGHHSDAEAFRVRVRGGIDEYHMLSGRYFSLSSAARVHQLLRRRFGEFDYLHMQPPGDPRFLPLLSKVPTVLTLHEPNRRPGVFRHSKFRAMPARNVERIYRSLAKALVVHTQEGFESLSRTERRKAVVIPHGVPVSNRRQLGSMRHKTVLFFGRAAAYKGIGVLIDAMRAVWKTEPEARLRILASPADLPCDFGDLDPRISATWSGYSESQLDAALNDAHAVCLPYTTVSGTGVGTRAYGAGKPVVASDLEGLRELVTDRALLVRPNDVADLARALTTALGREYSAQPVDPERTWPRIAATHIELYKQISRGLR